MWRNKLRGRHRPPGEEGQGLIEAAVAVPLLLGIAFNLINITYFWIMILALSASPRQGVEFATQGGAAGTGAAAPAAASVTTVVNANLTPALGGGTASVRFCTNANSVVTCSGSSSSATPGADPEASLYTLTRVDVEYTVTPIIPGTAFTVILPSNLTFHRQVSMRSLY